MLTCTPKSLCSRDFWVTGGLGGDGSVCFNTFTEQGLIYKNGTKLTVSKHGWLSGRWSLKHNDVTLAEAAKTSIFTRTLRIDAGNDVYFLKPRSLFTRGFNIVCEKRVVGKILPKHAWTRRAQIECEAFVTEEIQLFGFWLVAMLWRRAARNSKGAAPS